MHFVLAANYRLRVEVQRCIASLEALGYPWTVFDLGGLGIGEPFTVIDKTFHSQGIYSTCYTQRETRAMHKPDIVRKLLDNKDPWLVYLDADTFVRRRIDEIIADYDIGITVRPNTDQLVSESRINAGVLFFHISEATRNFVDQWKQETLAVGNDQAALCNLIRKPTSKISEFPVDIYNWYRFPKAPPPEAKILHYRVSFRPILGTFCKPDF
jgi:hypothetical protein